MIRLLPVRILCALPLVFPILSIAAPVAEDDVYSAMEDQPLNALGGTVFDASFDGSTSGTISWRYLDRIENSLGNGDPYPVDGTGKQWNDPAFNTATSTITPWTSGTLPIQTGGINVFPSLPDLLFGIDAAPNGTDNLVNTYLYRGTVSLNAVEAAEADWVLSVMADDGCIIFINGVEVERYNMDPGEYSPAGPVTTETLTNLSSETYVDLPVDLSGVLIAGTNTIAVEVHQASLDSSDTGFDFTMAPAASGTSGFAFNNNNTQNAQSNGTLDASGGFTGNGLAITVGGSGNSSPARGEWERDFDMTAAGTVSVTFRYRMVMDSGYENDEYSEIYAEIDGTPYGLSGNDYLARIFGNGNGGGDDETGWQQTTLEIPLPAGSHTLSLGVFNSKSTVASETTVAYFDDVSLFLPGGVLANDTTDPGSASVSVVTGTSHGSLTLDPAGTFFYTPDPEFSGTDSFTYQVTDNTGTSNAATVTINVQPVNDIPSAADDPSYSTAEDTPLTISAPGVLGNDSDVENDTLSASVVADVLNGSLSLSPDGSFTYTPDLNFNGTDSFTYLANDGNDDSAPATVTITVTPVNDAPVPSDDAYSTFQNQPLTVSTAANPGSSVVIAAGSEWRYLDDGSDQGIGWRDPGFNDAAWATGDAKLGYGDGNEVTTVGFGPDAGDKYVTTYFRRNFVVNNPELVGRLVVSIQRDDGAAVYLNGVEVIRDGLATDAAFDEYSLGAVAGTDEEVFFDFEIDASNLVTGNNVLAVEVHQATPTSSDMGFDLSMEAFSYAGVLDNDIDPDSDPLTAQITSQPANGSVSLNPNGTFTYTPDTGFQGIDTFTYEASDSEFSTGSTVEITVVRAGNTSPIAIADAYAVAEDTPLVVNAAQGVLANDTDAQMDPMTPAVSLQPANGSLTLNPDGSFTYTPAPNFFGEDIFAYTVSDGLATSPSAGVTITVTPVNDPPLAQNDTYSVLEDNVLEADLTAPSGNLDQTLIPAGSLWRYLDDGSNQGTAWRNPAFDDSSWSTGAAELGYGDGDETTEVSFGPDDNDKYPTTYFRHQFTVTDAQLVEDLRLFLMIDDGGVVYLNGNPVVSLHMPALYDYLTYTDGGQEGDFFTEFNIDPANLVEGVNTIAVEVHQIQPDSSDISMELYLEATFTEILGVLANDSDAENDTLTANLVAQPANGIVNLASDGTFTYTPDSNYFGEDTFDYTVTDGADTVSGTVTITVIPGPNLAPVTQPDSYTVTEDTLLVRSAAQGVLSNDTDPDMDPLTAVVVGQPAHGSLSLAADGSFTYQPDAQYSGSDSFSYIASDAQVNSTATQVSITVTPVNDPPATVADSYVVQPNGSLATTIAEGVLANDSEYDGQTMTALLVSSTGSGSLNLASDGSFTYTPNASFAGTDSFTYRASDGGLFSAPTTVTIYVNAQPTATGDVYVTQEDTQLTVVSANGVLKNDSDPTGESLTAVLVSPPTGGQLNLAANGGFTFIPATDFYGQASFTYSAADPVQSSAPATVNIIVNPVNDAPVGSDDSYTVSTTGVTSVAAFEGVLANDSDIDSTGLTAVLESDVTDGILTLIQDGSFSYTPGVSFSGIDSFTYRVSDGALTSDPVTVVLADIPKTKAIVINEIMYHPGSESPVDEYIELHNTATFPINLLGWRITKGVDFTFPDVTIPAGGFLVVAADPAAFAATYGSLPNVIGPWTGQLSNSGELIRLRDDFDEQGDEVEYSDQGDWAQRVRIRLGGEDGWDWFADHDGGGQSIELINPAVTNKNGQNWATSVGAPTPGVVNSTAAADIAPLISDVLHSPAVPKSTDSVTITATLKDLEGSALGALLRYRVSTASPGPFIDVPMYDDGDHNDGEANDGVFTATLPPHPDQTVIEFYVRSSDGINVRHWPAATDVGQVANALFQFNDETFDGQHLIYHLIMTVQEDEAFTDIDRGSDAEMNTTLIIDDCSSWKVRYLCGTRVRGAGSRNHTPVPRRVNLPRDTPLDGSTRMNLNTRFPHSQYIGMKLMHIAGIPAPDTKAIAMRRNGVDEMRDDEFDHGLAVHVEPLGGEFVDDKFPDDNQGNLYKKIRPDNDWAYRNGDAGDYVSDGWLKRTNNSENDYSDLDEFLRVMNQADGDADYIDQVEVVANIDQWMQWFAVNAILANGETNASNGADDDYSMYRGVIDPRFVFIPHDLDTILGRGDNSAIEDPEHTIFDMLERGDVLDPLVPLFNNTQIRQRYFTAMRRLLQEGFSKPEFDELINNHLVGWVPANTRSDIISFMDARRTYIEGILDTELGAPVSPPAATTRGSFASGHGSLYISEILADNNGVLANGASFPDAVELYNAGTSPVDLGGMSLSDESGDPQKFVFAPGTVIGAQSYLVVFADSNTADPGIHLGFQLDNNGETLTWYDSSQQVLDSISYGVQVPGLSIGRVGVNAGSWTLALPSFGSANTAVALGNPDTLRINEWMAQPELVFEDDFVELYNPDALPVALGGLAVTDEFNTAPQRHVLPDLSYMPGSGFLLFTAKGGSASPGNPTELPFKLSSIDGWMTIAGDNGEIIDNIYYDCHRYDLAQGRSPDGSATYADFLLPTPGLSNGTDLTAESAVISSLRITEIMYNPPGGSALEYVELTNIGTQTIQLGDVRFNDGISFDFPAMTLDPGAFVLVVNDLAAFEGLYGTGLPVAGEYSGNLSNGGENVRLEITSLGAGIHDFEYDDAWYPSTDGDGYALVIANPLISRHDWGIKESWIAGEAGGTPGENELVVLAGIDQTIVLGDGAVLDSTVFEGTTTPSQLTLTWSQESGPAGVTFGDPSAGDTTAGFTQPGRYLLKLTAVTPQKTSSGTVGIIVTDTYDQWVVRTFGGENPPFTDRGFDADGDGITNFLEFLFGTDPQNVNALAVTASIENGFLTLTYTLHYVDAGEYSITPEFSSDLSAWINGTGGTDRQIIADTGETMTVRIQDIAPVGTDDQKFLRLKVISAQ